MNLDLMLSKFLAFFRTLIMNNWSLAVAAIIALIGLRFLKTGVHLAVTVAFAAMIISILTNVGILPPLDVMWQTAKAWITETLPELL